MTWTPSAAARLAVMIDGSPGGRILATASVWTVAKAPFTRTSLSAFSSDEMVAEQLASSRAQDAEARATRPSSSTGRAESGADHSSMMRNEPKLSTWALAMPSTSAVKPARARRAPEPMTYEASPTMSDSVPSSARLDRLAIDDEEGQGPVDVHPAPWAELAA